MRTRLIPAILTLGMTFTMLTAVLPPTAAAADDEPQEQAVVAAQVAADEKSVALSATGDALANAERVVFVVGPQGAGSQKTLRHEAVRRADGSWAATAFIAANGFSHAPVPYNCRVANAVHRLFDPTTGHHLYTTDLNEADTLSQGVWNYEGVAWVEPLEEAASAPEGPMTPEIPEDQGAGDATEAAGGEEPGDEAAEVAEAEDEAEAQAGALAEGESIVEGGDAADATATESEPQPEPEPQPEQKIETVYRLFHPETGEHLYTTDTNEYATLPSYGWRQEGEAFRSDPAKGMTVYRLFDPSTGKHLYTTDTNERSTLLGLHWNDEGIGWYGASVNEDGSWCAATRNRFHNSAGTYEVEVQAYAEPSAADAGALAAEPEGQVAGTASFTISSPKASARVANVNDAKGTYDVIVENVDSPSGVAKVQVPTWTVPNDQDDIVWYDAPSQGDGTYKASVNVARHSFTNDFVSHVYLTAGNGVMAGVAQANCHLTLANYIKFGGGPYTYTIAIYNPGAVHSVQVPSWSDANGQDDIVWADAHDEGNGWWSATIDARRFSSSGLCYAHVYADGTLRGGVSFTVQPWEILEWRYRNMLDRVWNLSSPSTYLLAVDTSNCFVGVFRGSRGNWVNSTWWDCAPGTWATPTVKGVFSVGSRGYAFGHGYTCYYWTQFYNDYLFHSIKYYEGTFTPLDPTLGSPASLGCVRLDIQNAKWIHDNVPSGTTVLVY